MNAAPGYRWWPGVVAVVLAGSLLSACTSPGTPAPPPAPRATTVAEFFGAALTIEDYGSFGEAQTELVSSDDSRFDDVLRVHYPAGSASQTTVREDGSPSGGAQFYLRWSSGPVDEAYLRYFVRFPDGFQFVKGGKLPGLFGGRVTSGQHIPDGTNGFSTRYMWRADGLGEVYAYLPTSQEHGTSLGRGAWSWPTGEWIDIEQHVRLNTPGQADGSVQVWLDGALVLDQDGLTFRSTDELAIDGLFFSTFFGGDDPSWASPTDQYAEFAGFVIADQFLA